jgi:hypothetical protein
MVTQTCGSIDEDDFGPKLEAEVRRVWTEEALVAALGDASTPIIIQNRQLARRLRLVNRLRGMTFVGRFLTWCFHSELLRKVAKESRLEAWELKEAHGRPMLSPRPKQYSR